MDDSPIELVIEILVRVGIVTAHAMELIGGYKAITFVIVCWSIEEIVGIVSNKRKLRGLL